VNTDGCRPLIFSLNGARLVLASLVLVNAFAVEAKELKATGAQARKYRTYAYDIDDLIRAESDPDFERYVQQRRQQELLQQQEAVRFQVVREQEEAKAEASRRAQRQERQRALEAERLQSRLEAQHNYEQQAYEDQQEFLRERYIAERSQNSAGRAAPLRMPAALQRVIRANEQASGATR
jgi:hypothetical protein